MTKSSKRHRTAAPLLFESVPKAVDRGGWNSSICLSVPSIGSPENRKLVIKVVAASTEIDSYPLVGDVYGAASTAAVVVLLVAPVSARHTGRPRVSTTECEARNAAGRPQAIL